MASQLNLDIVSMNCNENDHCPYFLPKLHIASAINFQTKYLICKQHINDTSNIQKTMIANNKLSEDPAETNFGTVKMMETKSEGIVIK